MQIHSTRRCLSNLVDSISERGSRRVTSNRAFFSSKTPFKLPPQDIVTSLHITSLFDHISTPESSQTIPLCFDSALLSLPSPFLHTTTTDLFKMCSDSGLPAYVPGTELALVVDEANETFPGNLIVTITRVISTTMATVLEVTCTNDSGTATTKAVLKLFDRRFGSSLRRVRALSKSRERQHLAGCCEHGGEDQSRGCGHA